MAKYRVTFKKSVVKDLRGMPNRDVKRILDKITWLCHDPRAEGCIKLSVNELYRTRQGLYRIIYEIRDEILVINVVKVAHKSNVYKNG